MIDKPVTAVERVLALEAGRAERHYGHARC
jgi:hypothetical protein